MGCTPSIQINQADVVYRRDFSDSGSPLASRSTTVISGTTIVMADKSDKSHKFGKVKTKGYKSKVFEIEPLPKPEIVTVSQLILDF